MARLIEAEKVYELGHRTPFHIGIADLCDLRDLLADVPTVDAVKVVRCRDCKHMILQSNMRYCTVWHGPNGMGDDGFCNYGERKDGDGNG